MATRKAERTTWYRERVPRFPKQLLVFFVVCVAWVFFRADTFTDAFAVLEQIVTFADGLASRADLFLVLVLGVIALGIDLFTRTARNPIAALGRVPALAGAAVTAAVAAIIVFSGGTPEPFIYFQF